MKQQYKYSLSYPDSIKIQEELHKKREAIADILAQNIKMTEKEVMSTVNKLVYEQAEKTNTSVYDICFTTIPDLMFNFPDAIAVTLRPVEFDFDHDDGYWKEKYYALKQKVQSIIDTKEDEL